ncbi:hypothetical protein SLS62_006333 [Diatrype stigma]|uniref:Xylanolytic transcriptional activator regulatory domain-containing protein n=1 Tax=Diatrype stigma TaxID=117547 RepID=A0AAN9UQU4_9PEZI
MREILSGNDKDDECSTPADAASPDDNMSLLLPSSSTINLRELHPPAAHIFFLWQTFLDRVNPVTKVIHVPTLQPRVAEAATNLDAIPLNVEALLFSIYTMAAVALTENESLAFLGYPRREAVDRFSKGVRIALMRIDILKNYDLVILQAMVLYMTSLFRRYDRHAAWILNGVIVRMGQKIGLHKDGEELGVSPFEAEMRRRVWWQIMMLDTVYALMSGLGQSLLPRTWSTRAPHNVNDADLYPAMTTIQSRDGPTDMIFCLMQYEIGKMLVQVPSLELAVLHNERALKEPPEPAEIAKACKYIDELDDNITNLLEKFCDLSMGPVHELAMEMRPTWVAKLRDLVEPSTRPPERGTEQHTPRDGLFRMAVSGGEHNLNMYRVAKNTGQFVWFILTHFQVEIFIFMTGQLTTRTSGDLVERAWVVVEKTYKYYEELYDFSLKVHGALAARVVQAWKVREKVLQERNGCLPPTPAYILNLEGLLANNDSKYNTPSNTTASSTTESHDTPGAISSRREESNDTSWDQMLGFLDAGSINWDSLSGDWQSQMPSYPGYGQSTGGFNGNSWM